MCFIEGQVLSREVSGSDLSPDWLGTPGRTPPRSPMQPRGKEPQIGKLKAIHLYVYIPVPMEALAQMLYRFRQQGMCNGKPYYVPVALRI